MEQNNSNMPEFCVNNCGFYGSPIYNHMCSKCFKQLNEQSKQSEPLTLSKTILPDFTSQTEAVHSTAAEVEVKTDVPNPVDVPIEAVQETSDISEEPTPKKVQNNKSRCFFCRAKIPLSKQTANRCRCDYVYCDSHRYPDKHDCDYDFAGKDRNILAKNNPKLNDRPKGGRSFTRLED